MRRRCRNAAPGSPPGTSRWLADEKGGVLTATLDGRPIGVSKVTVLAPSEVWLEGLRIDPEVHGHGYSRALHERTLHEAIKLRPRSIRFSTGYDNAVPRHIAETEGFWLVSRSKWLWSKPGKKAQLRSRPARLSELDAVERYVKSSECFRATSGLFAYGWKFVTLNKPLLKRLVSAGQVLVCPRKGRIRAVGAYDYSDIDGEPCLGFVDGPDSDVAIIARDLRAVAASTGS